MTALTEFHLKGIVRLIHHLRAFDGEHLPIKTGDRIEVVDIHSEDLLGWVTEQEEDGWLFIPALA